FQYVRRDALYCSPGCGQKAHRAGKAQLLPAHVGERGAVPTAAGMQDATLAARIEVPAHAVAELHARLGNIDSASEQPAKRGGPKPLDGHRKPRQVRADERQRKASPSADLKPERATWRVEGRQIETEEAAPIRHVEPIGADADGEWAIRWLLALM